MNKQEAIEAFRAAVKAEHKANIPENATEEMRRIALVTGDTISRLSADHLEHWFHIYEDIFTTYLSEKWDASKKAAD